MSTWWWYTVAFFVPLPHHPWLADDVHQMRDIGHAVFYRAPDIPLQYTVFIYSHKGVKSTLWGAGFDIMEASGESKREGECKRDEVRSGGGEWMSERERKKVPHFFSSSHLYIQHRSPTNTTHQGPQGGTTISVLRGLHDGSHTRFIPPKTIDSRKRARFPASFSTPKSRSHQPSSPNSDCSAFCVVEPVTRTFIPP